MKVTSSGNQKMIKYQRNNVGDIEAKSDGKSEENKSVTAASADGMRQKKKMVGIVDERTMMKRK